MILCPDVRWLRVRGMAAGTLLILLTCAVYLPSLRGAFLLDDDVLLTNSNWIQDADGLYRIWFTSEPADYWPVTNTSFWIEWRCWGNHPLGYRVTNLAFHISAALLLWIILRKLFIPGAFFAALLFAVHPLNVESVAWIAQRKNVLSMFFFLLSILCWLKANRGRGTRAELQAGQTTSNSERRLWTEPLKNRWYWLSLVVFLLAMLSKGSVAILPLVLLLIAWWQNGRTSWRTLLLHTAPFFLAAVALAAVNVWFQTHGTGDAIRSVSFAQRLAGAGAVTWFYLGKAIFPVGLVFVYPQWNIQTSDFRWWLPLLAAIAVTVILFLNRRRPMVRPLLMAWAFFCIGLLPVLGFVDVGFMRYSLVANHYVYAALIGVTTLVAATLVRWHQHAQGMLRSLAILVAAAILGGCGFLSLEQCRLYADPARLYSETLGKTPDSWLIENILAKYDLDRDQPQLAQQHCQQALRLKPDLILAQCNLGTAFLDMGMFQEAADRFESILKIDPEMIIAHSNLGLALANLGRLPEAIRHGQKAISLQPKSALVHNNLGVALFLAGQTAEAIQQYQECLNLDPEFSRAYSNLGNALLRLKQPQEAIQQYRFGLRLKPDDAVTHYNLGNALLQSGQMPAAIEQFDAALRLKSNLPEAHFNASIAWLASGQPSEALQHCKQAIELRADYAEAYANMALALAQLGRIEDARSAASQGLDLARSQGNQVLVDRIQSWLQVNQIQRPEGKP